MRTVGIKSSPSFVRQPEGNGCIERFICALKEQPLRLRRFRLRRKARPRVVKVQGLLQPVLEHPEDRLPNPRPAPERTPPGGRMNTRINLSLKPVPPQSYQVGVKIMSRIPCSMSRTKTG